MIGWSPCSARLAGLEATRRRVASTAILVFLWLLAERTLGKRRGVVTPWPPGISRLVFVPRLFIQSRHGLGLGRAVAGGIAMMLLTPLMTRLVVLAWLVTGL